MDSAPPRRTGQRPKISPYISRPVALLIGSERTQYHVAQDLLQSPKWIASCNSWGQNIITLPNVDKSIGHVLVHYLYTGTYQTLDNTAASPVEETHVELKRAILVHIAASIYELCGLQQLAKQKLEDYSAKMNIFDIIEVIKDDVSKLPSDALWLHTYLCGKVKTAFEEDHTMFARNDLFGSIDNIAVIRVLANCVTELYNNKILYMFSVEKARISESQEVCVNNNVMDMHLEALPAEDSFTVVKRPNVEGCLAQDFSIIEAPIPRESLVKETAATPVEAAKSLPNDSSWADAQANNDGWATLGTSTKKKDKKRKSAQTAPTPPSDPPVPEPTTTFDEIILDDNGGSAPKNDMDFGGWRDTKSGFGISGCRSWTSRWESSNKTLWGPDYNFDTSKDSPVAAKDSPWGSTEKKKESSSFDFDAHKGTCAPRPATEKKLAEDGGQGFGVGTTVRATKKKGKKSLLVEESVPDEPATTPEPEKKEEDDQWSFLVRIQKEKKKYTDAKEEPKVEELLPPPPEQEVVPQLEPTFVEKKSIHAREDWGAPPAVAKKSKKKKKKGSVATAIPDPPTEEPVVECTPPLKPELESQLEPERITSPDWGSTERGGGDKKKKKGNVVEAEGDILPEEPPPIQEPVAAEEPTEDKTECSAPSWSRKKKKNFKKDAPVEISEDTNTPVQKLDKDDLWGSTASNIGKKTKNPKKGHLTPNAPTPPGEFDSELLPPESIEASPIKKKKEDAIWGFASTSTKKKQKNVEISDHALRMELEQPLEAEGVICPSRAEHLLERDRWKSCNRCRAFLSQVTAELAHKNLSMR